MRARSRTRACAHVRTRAVYQASERAIKRQRREIGEGEREREKGGGGEGGRGGDGGCSGGGGGGGGSDNLDNEPLQQTKSFPTRPVSSKTRPALVGCSFLLLEAGRLEENVKVTALLVLSFPRDVSLPSWPRDGQGL